jgi:hypothetical protein
LSQIKKGGILEPMQGHTVCQVKPALFRPYPSKFPAGPVVATAFPEGSGVIIFIFFSLENPVKFTDPDGRSDYDNILDTKSASIANVNVESSQGPFSVSGTANAGYAEYMVRGQGISGESTKGTIGLFGKVSGGNVAGKIGVAMRMYLSFLKVLVMQLLQRHRQDYNLIAMV